MKTIQSLLTFFIFTLLLLPVSLLSEDSCSSPTATINPGSTLRSQKIDHPYVDGESNGQALFYKIVLTQKGTLHLNTNTDNDHPTDQVDTYGELLDENCALLYTDTQIHTSPRYFEIEKELEAGTYYLRVYNEISLDDSNTDNAKGYFQIESSFIATAAQKEIFLEQTAPDSVDSDSDITYTVYIKNYGTLSTASVKVTIALPEHLEYVEVTNAQGWSCQKNTDLECTLDDGTIANDKSKSFQIIYHSDILTQDTTVSNQAHALITYEDESTLDRYDTTDVTIWGETPSVDISIQATKPDSDTTISNVIKGELFDYKITISNDGTLDDENVTISDIIPSEYTFDSLYFDNTIFNCTQNDANINCTLLSTLDTYQSYTFRIRVRATGNTGETNSADIAADTVLGHITDSDSVTVSIEEQNYSIAMDKSVQKAQIVNGHTTYYVLKMTNNGNMTLSNATITDSIPSQLEVLNLDNISQWNCNASDLANNAVSCQLNTNLEPGNSESFIVNVKAKEVANDISNTAMASADIAPDASDNVSINILPPQPKISISKSAPSAVKSLDTFYYSFDIDNSGSETLSNIRLNDDFDTELIIPSDWDDSIDSTWSCTINNHSLSCTYADSLMEEESAKTLKIKVRAPYTTETKTIDNTATTVADHEEGDVTAEDNISVQINPILEKMYTYKETDKSTLYSGENYTYSIYVGNSGNVTFKDIKIIDNIPSLLDGNFTIDNGNFDCSSSHDTYIECTLDELAPEEEDFFTISVLAPVVSQSTTITNMENATSKVIIDDYVNDTLDENASVDVTILPPQSNLFITKDASQDIVLENDQFDYTLVVENGGLAEETNLALTDDIPSDFKIISISSGAWSCNESDNTVSCTLPSLAAKTTADTITIQVEAPSSIQVDKSIRNSAKVTSTQDTDGKTSFYDVDLLSNNSALRMHISSHPSSVYAGDIYYYDIFISNNSGKDIDTVTITDTLPPDVEFDHYDSGGWSCDYDNNSRLFSCDNNGTKFTSTEKSIYLYVKAPGYETNVTNTATLSSSLSSYENNDTAVTFVKGRDTHLVFTKAYDTKDPVKKDELYSYILQVQNLADTPLTDINATDLNLTFHFDENITLQSVETTQWSCSGTQTLTCTLPYLEQGEKSPEIKLNVVCTDYGYKSSLASIRAKESLSDENITLSTEVKEIVKTDMILEIEDTPDPVEAEDFFRYDFTITNTHPTKAVEGIVLDINTTSAENYILTGYEDNSVWSCTQSGTQVHCEMNDVVAANSQVHLFLDAQAPTVPTVLEINATLSSEYLDDTNYANNTTNEQTEVIQTNLTEDHIRDFTRVPIQGNEDTNIYGDVLSIGNQVVCEKDNSGTCKEPSYMVNDLTDQTYVNLDPAHASAYQTATSAKLTLSPTDEVIWAGLYWMGRIDKTKSGASDKMKAASKVYLRHESDSSYQQILSLRSTTAIDNSGNTITGIDKFNFINDSDYFDYQGMADVTDYVKSHKGGDYWVADVQVSEGDNISAGWNLVVIVMDTAEVPTRNLRNITVFDGFQGVWKSPEGYTDKYPDEVNQTVEGFLTPAYGVIDSKLYMFAFEGDKTLDDYIKITDKSGISHTLTNSANPADDVVNGTISDRGTIITQRNPALFNTSGIDIDIFNLGDVNEIENTGIIQHEQTSTNITIGSGDGTDSGDGGDRFFLGMFAFSTNLHQPLCYNQKFKTEDYSQDLGSEVYTGDTVGIEIELRNTEVQDVNDLQFYTYIDPILKEDNSSFEIKNIDTSGNLDTSFHAQNELFDFNQVPLTTEQNQTEVVSRVGANASSTTGGDLYDDKYIYIRYKALIDNTNDENKTLNIYKVSYKPTNKKIMIPPCNTQPTFPHIVQHHTNGFNTLHKNALNDGVIDGYQNSDPAQPNNEQHLFTQVANQPFDIDIIALDDNNPSMLRNEPYKGIINLELVEYNSSNPVCEQYQSLKNTDVNFNTNTIVTKTFNYSNAQKTALFRVRYLVDKYGKLLEWEDNTLTLSNLTTVLYDSGYTDRCSNTCTGTSASIDACKSCLFKTTNNGGLAKLSCSSDTFVIKPENIALDLNDTPPFIGAKNYTLNLDANTTFYNPIIDSSTGALNFTLLAPPGCTATPASGNLLTSSLTFTDGNASLNPFSYPNVGSVKLDYVDHIWTYYDQNTTDANMSDCILNSSSNIPDSSGKVGCDVSGTKTVTFIPEKFTTTATLNSIAGNQVYLSNELNMSAILRLTVTAKLNNGTTATNYTAGCFSDDINYTLSIGQEPYDWNARTDINTSIVIGGNGVSSIPLGGTTLQTPAAYFSGGTATNLPVFINFSRQRTLPQEPFILRKNDFNLTVNDSYGVSGGDFDKSSDQNLSFYYTRAYLSNYGTDKESCVVPVFYEAYCKNCDKSKYFNTNEHESVDAIHWYNINDRHTLVAQGQILSASAKNHTQIDAINLKSLTLSLGTLQAPHRDRITYKASSWLQNNKYKESIDTNSFNITFYPSVQQWGGKGKVNKTVDLNVSSRAYEKIEW